MSGTTRDPLIPGLEHPGAVCVCSQHLWSEYSTSLLGSNPYRLQVQLKDMEHSCTLGLCSDYDTLVYCVSRLPTTKHVS